jgi:hypothetical protein
MEQVITVANIFNNFLKNKNFDIRDRELQLYQSIMIVLVIMASLRNYSCTNP